MDVTPSSREYNGRDYSHLIKLDVREPRLRRVRYGRVLKNHPVNEEFEEQLSKPFYFQQEEHGTVTEVLFPKDSESPEIAAFKKGKIESNKVGLRNRAINVKNVWNSKFLCNSNTNHNFRS